jgi:hypothetical protein
LDLSQAEKSRDEKRRKLASISVRLLKLKQKNDILEPPFPDPHFEGRDRQSQQDLTP